MSIHCYKEAVKMGDEHLVPVQSMVMPAVSTAEAVKSWEAYQDLKNKVKTKDDIQLIQGKEFLKKSYWRKIARFFNLSVEIVEERTETLEGGRIIYHFKARATAPNGAFSEGVGSCDNMEKGRVNSIHNTRTTAETRSWNRSVSNLVGGGEVSAEEVDQDEAQTKHAQEAISIICPKCGKPAIKSKFQKKEGITRFYCSDYKSGCKGEAEINNDSGEVIVI
jgi:hypothetical protein